MKDLFFEFILCETLPRPLSFGSEFKGKYRLVVFIFSLAGLCTCVMLTKITTCYVPYIICYIIWGGSSVTFHMVYLWNCISVKFYAGFSAIIYSDLAML